MVNFVPISSQYTTPHNSTLWARYGVCILTSNTRFIFCLSHLLNWGRVMHIYVSKRGHQWSGYGLSLVPRQSIIWANAQCKKTTWDSMPYLTHWWYLGCRGLQRQWNLCLDTPRWAAWPTSGHSESGNKKIDQFNSLALARFEWNSR